MTVLSRRVGIEMEGYIENYPTRSEIRGVQIGKDGSLQNSEWEYDDEAYGVELKTDPITDLSELYATWNDMQSYGWSTDDRAGTHIHVEIIDFTNLDKVKLLRFCKAIEPIMFSFVDEYRYDNNYCNDIHKDWRNIFRSKSRYCGIDWNDVGRNITYYLDQRFPYSRSNSNPLGNGKYQWLNVLGSRYHTAEFRLFHAVQDMDELIKQARMAEAIVSLVKNCTTEQLEFIIKELYRTKDIDKTIGKFFEALNLDFILPVKCEEAMEKVNKILSKPRKKKKAKAAV
jgi:hypothetical protein